MRCSVNLLPAVHLHARARARRRAGWVTLCAACGALVAGGWVVQHLAGRALARLASRAGELDARTAEVQRRLVAAHTERGELLARLETVAQARRPQPWPPRLLQLTQTAPEGVFFTHFSATSTDAHTPNPGVPARAVPSPQAGSTGPGERAPLVQAVRIMGYAVDHAALIQLLNTLQNQRDWQQVELVRATLEPYQSRLAVAFEFDCRTQEGVP